MSARTVGDIREIVVNLQQIIGNRHHAYRHIDNVCDILRNLNSALTALLPEMQDSRGNIMLRYFGSLPDIDNEPDANEQMRFIDEHINRILSNLDEDNLIGALQFVSYTQQRIGFIENWARENYPMTYLPPIVL